MELTGKCKEDFEVWYNDVQRYNMGWFYRLQEEYQYGVYVDFFDSVGIQLSIHCWDNNKYSFTTLKEGRYMRQHKPEVTSRQEAREQAITKVNEVYNDANR